MAKSKKNRYSGVMAYSNQYPFSRITSVSIDSDLNEEEIREIGNEEVVERVDQTPTVSITIDTNESASSVNLRYLIQEEIGTNVTIDSFDGPTADIVLSVEEDNVFTRSLHVNDASPVGVSWNFDVGGLATESFNLEGDNYTWYINDFKILRCFNAIAVGPATGGVNAVSGVGIGNTSCVVNSWPDFGNELESRWKPIKTFVDGQNVGTNVTGWNIGATPAGGNSHYFTSGGGNQYYALANYLTLGQTLTTGHRVRLLAAQISGTINTRLKTYGWGVTERLGATAVGGVSKGMINIHFAASGVPTTTASTNFLRCQTASIDVDLARETLEELGHDRAFEKTLTLPVNVNVTFNTLASDLEEFAKFSDRWNETTGTVSGYLNELSIADFGKFGNLVIGVYDAKDTASTRTLQKSITITGLDISSQSYGVDVGGNATQDFTAIATNVSVATTDDSSYANKDLA